MPIKYNGKAFSFEQLVRLVMRTKGWTRDRAAAYVATIERKQKPSQ